MATFCGYAFETSGLIKAAYFLATEQLPVFQGRSYNMKL
jgi:hypothetical protein